MALLSTIGLLVSVVASSPVQTCAPTGGDAGLSGQVTDVAGTPISYAVVSVQSLGSNVAVLTDKEGCFSAILQSSLDLQTVRITVSAPGYNPVTIPHNGGLKGVIVLDAATLGDVVVVARRISRAFAPHSADKLSLLTDPAARADPLMAVESLPFSTNTNNSADLELRGARSGLSRIYLNDVPIYESVRGSAVDRATRANSIFPAAIVGEVEVYPSHPPAYLAGSAGGALRVLTQDNARASGTFVVSSVAVAADRTLPSGGSGQNYLQPFVSVTDMGLATVINSELKASLRNFRSASVGINSQAEFSGGVLRLFMQADHENGTYPLNLFTFEDDLRSRRDRRYAIASYGRRMGEVDISASFAATGTEGRERFGIMDLENQNRYYFSAFDVAGQAGKAISYRFGFDAERITLRSDGVVPALFYVYRPDGPEALVSRRSQLRETSAYLYSTATLSSQFALQGGIRQTVDSSLGGETGWQVGAAFSSPGGRHKLLAGVGTYFTADLPESSDQRGIARVTSSQASVDYQRLHARGRSGFSLFRSVEKAGETETVTKGLEASVAIDLTQKFSGRWSYALIDQTIDTAFGRQPGQGDLGGYFRTSLQYRHSSALIFGLYYAARNGVFETPIVRGIPAAGADWVVPVFGTPSRLPRYESLDVNVAYILPRAILGRRPISFLAISNMLDEENIQSYVYNDSYEKISPRFYQGRVISAGVVIAF